LKGLDHDAYLHHIVDDGPHHLQGTKSEPFHGVLLGFCSPYTDGLRTGQDSPVAPISYAGLRRRRRATRIFAQEPADCRLANPPRPPLKIVSGGAATPDPFTQSAKFSRQKLAF